MFQALQGGTVCQVTGGLIGSGPSPLTDAGALQDPVSIISPNS
jgi:hypothetical protein